MCNLQTHIERDAQVQQARRREPIYAELTDKYLMPYDPPTEPDKPNWAERFRDMHALRIN